MRIADLIRHACDRLGMDQFSLLQIDRERSQLIDHIGACERILGAPLPRAYTIHIRRFIFLYLTTLPFAMPVWVMVAGAVNVEPFAGLVIITVGGRFVVAGPDTATEENFTVVLTVGSPTA